MNQQPRSPAAHGQVGVEAQTMNGQPRQLPMAIGTPKNRNPAKRWRTAVGGATASHVGLPEADTSEMKP